MSNEFASHSSFPQFNLWERTQHKRLPFSFDIEITARCNCDCRHCYINLPAGDQEAQRRELSLEEIADLADQSVKLGALWCLVTGGEPLLRKDFADIYIMLKKKGLLVSVFTNACLVNEEHIQLFKKYPPRDIEVTVYGVTRETYERVTRKAGSFNAFQRGLGLLLENNIPVRLKSIAIHSNLPEFQEIGQFCRQYSKDYFRFDPLIISRIDGNPVRNREIISERLSPQEIVKVESEDQERANAIDRSCNDLLQPNQIYQPSHYKVNCSAGANSFSISYDGYFRLCSSLLAPSTTYDLRQGSLEEAWFDFVPQVRKIEVENSKIIDKCHSCNLVNLCLWCPANAYLETGQMDDWSEYFCAVAHARAAALQERLEQVSIQNRI
jgi:radical SAM protein with 4Fe4S-binding SPASM domain